MEINIQDEKMAFENAWLVPHELEFFDFDLKKNQYLLKEQYVSDDESPIAIETYHSLNSGWAMWLKAKAHEAKKLEDCVVVPLENALYFSMDGENYEIHDNLVQAKDEAVRAIEYYSDRLADQQLDPRSDGNFQQISYGIVLAGSSYSVDHIVTQQDIDDGEHSYDVGTEIMSLFLVEAARGGNE